MADELQVEAAIMDIAAADTGAGGLVPLTGKTQPVVSWGELVEADPPVMAIQYVDSSLSEGAPPRVIGIWRFDAWADERDNGLEVTLLERLATILNQQAFQAQGLDVSVRRLVRRNTTALADTGRRRTEDYRLTLTR